MATLGISNRISLAILELATEQYLTSGNLDVNYLTEQLRTELTGELRIKKALQQLNAFFKNNAILPFFDSHREELLSAMRTQNDKAIIALSVFAAKSTFAYDLICQLAKLFHAEDLISTETIYRALGTKYGSNKNMTNTLYMAIPTIAEAGFFSRPKPGLYEYLPPLGLFSQIAREAWKEAFFANNPLYNREHTEHLTSEPFFQFIR